MRNRSDGAADTQELSRGGVSFCPPQGENPGGLERPSEPREAGRKGYPMERSLRSCNVLEVMGSHRPQYFKLVILQGEEMHTVQWLLLSPPQVPVNRRRGWGGISQPSTHPCCPQAAGSSVWRRGAAASRTNYLQSQQTASPQRGLPAEGTIPGRNLPHRPRLQAAANAQGTAEGLTFFL